MVVDAAEREEEAGRCGFHGRGRAGGAPFRKRLRTLSLVGASVHILCESLSIRPDGNVLKMVGHSCSDECFSFPWIDGVLSCVNS